jgi:POT family proton-dependent oligopeptide transporter
LPGAANEKLFLGHPRGLFLLFMVEMWERFSYYGMRALLVLYLIQSATGGENGFNPGRGWTKPDATNLYGWYTGLVYLTPLFGGMIADRIIGTHRSMLVGGSLIALGHVVLAISGFGSLAHNNFGMTVFVTGLALIVIGTGHFKPTVTVMVGQLYSQNDPRRDGAFTIFYMGINLGALICTFICGTLGEKVGWHWGFGSAAVGMIIGLSLYIIFKQSWLGNIGAAPRESPNRAPYFFIGAVILAVVIGALFHTGSFASMGQAVDGLTGTGNTRTAIYVVLALLIILWSVWFVWKQEPAYRGPTASILIFVIFNAVFWTAYEQAGSSLNIFASENTERHVLGWEVPATWFQSINPFMILLCGPLFALMWTRLGQRKLNPSQPMKIAIALFLVGGGYVFMVLGSMGAGETTAASVLPEGATNAGAVAAKVKVSMFWLFATYTLHTWGELCISPTGLAFVTRAAAVKYVSFLMGIYFLSNVVAGILGGILAGKVEGIEKGTISLPWYPWFKLGGQADFFLMFVIATMGAGLVVLALTPLLKKLTKSIE